MSKITAMPAYHQNVLRLLHLLAIGVAMQLLAPVVAHAAEPIRVPMLKLSQCPQAVQRTLVAEAKGSKITEVTTDDANGDLEYTTEVVIKDRHFSITVAATGKLIEKVLDNEEEKEIAFSDCPKAVRRTFADEADGTKIGMVEKETQNGVVWYSTEVKIGGDWYSITVAENGVLVEKTLEDDADDEDAPAKVVKTEHGADRLGQFRRLRI